MFTNPTVVCKPWLLWTAAFTDWKTLKHIYPHTDSQLKFKKIISVFKYFDYNFYAKKLKLKEKNKIQRNLNLKIVMHLSVATDALSQEAEAEIANKQKKSFSCVGRTNFCTASARWEQIDTLTCCWKSFTFFFSVNSSFDCQLSFLFQRKKKCRIAKLKLLPTFCCQHWVLPPTPHNCWLVKISRRVKFDRTCEDDLEWLFFRLFFFVWDIDGNCFCYHVPDDVSVLSWFS